MVFGPAGNRQFLVAAPAAPKPMEKVGAKPPPPSGMVVGAAGAAQTTKIDARRWEAKPPTFGHGFWGRRGRPNPQNRRLPAGPKTMYSKFKCSATRDHQASGLDFSLIRDGVVAECELQVCQRSGGRLQKQTTYDKSRCMGEGANLIKSLKSD